MGRKIEERLSQCACNEFQHSAMETAASKVIIPVACAELRIGENGMLNLLTTTSIFLPLSNDCYYQTSGTSLHDLSVQIPRAEKKRKFNYGFASIKLFASFTSRELIFRRSANQIDFVRSRIFYSRPSLGKNSEPRLGFKHQR